MKGLFAGSGVGGAAPKAKGFEAPNTERGADEGAEVSAGFVSADADSAFGLPKVKGEGARVGVGAGEVAVSAGFAASPNEK